MLSGRRLCVEWQNAEVWYYLGNSWRAGTVLEAQKNDEVWKFTIRPLRVGAGTVTLWPEASVLPGGVGNRKDVDFDTLKRRNLQDADSVHDLTKIHGISEPEMERMLTERFMQHQFYTEVGPVLLYLNYWGDLDETDAPEENLHDDMSAMIEADDDRFDVEPGMPDTSRLKKAPSTLPTLQEVFEAGERNLQHQVAPHPYKLADRVYRAMNLGASDVMKRENQTILLTGEAGSGKSRNLHYVLEYLTYASSMVAQQVGVMFAYDSEIEDLIMAANIITNSFGCAATHPSHPSSSRYGKYIELYYSDFGFLEGSAVRTFLLECSRVTHQAPHQRNFNVFGEISAGLTPYEKADFGFHVSPEFHYLSSEYTSVEGLMIEQERNARNYGMLRQAMTNVGMSSLRQIEAIKVLVSILHIGNITFEDKEGSDCSDCTSNEGSEDDSSEHSTTGVVFAESCSGHVEYACKILGFTTADLCGAITTKSMKVADKTVIVQNDIATSIKVRDTLAKTLYHSLFKWIVVEINRSLSENLGDYSAARIGILDMFGLDSFDVNHFDQMCQNYANEILQCHYFSVILDGQKKYFEEATGLWVLNSEEAANVESSKHIDVFESDFCGIFPILNSVMHSSKPSEEQFLAMLEKSNLGNPLLTFHSNKQQQQQQQQSKSKFFTIRHYAYDVTYSVENMLEMNQGLREINFATLSTSTSGREHRFSTDNSSVSRRSSSGGSPASTSPARSGKRLSKSDYLRGPYRRDSSSNSVGSKTPPPGSDKTKYKKVKTSVHKKQTIARSFVTEINELMAQIRDTRSHFFQCVRCSYEDKPKLFSPKLVGQQLKYCSCLKSIEALQNDLSLNMPYGAFVSEYCCLLYIAGKCPMTAGPFAALKVARDRPKHSRSQRVAALNLIEVIPVIGGMLAQIEHNPAFVKPGHCYSGIIFSDKTMNFSVEYLEFIESLKRSTINIIATRVQRIWKAHRLMLFKRYAQARGHHALVYIADMKCRASRSEHTGAVSIQRRVRVFLAVRRRLRVLAEIAYQARLTAAAIKCQAFVRCHLTRKDYLHEKIQGEAFAKLMTILGCDGEDLPGELELFHYQMDILKKEKKRLRQ